MLDHHHFPEYFAALWGLTPFAWQSELARRVAADRPADGPPSTAERRSHEPWPEAIALPTGAGKTACLDIAVFALAQAPSPEDDHAAAAPRRIFFVVDRRIIVDEAHERARCLARKLESAKDGILRTVADRLRHLACGGAAGVGDERPLVVHSLRGGAYRSEAWARNPLQPTIVASTVDQIGSRALFRAYGARPGTWPVYAGLVANDSLILLDEAHCSGPFLQTLRAVRKYREWAEKPLGRCFHTVVMSATPPPDVGDVFRDSSGEGRDPDHPLGRRQLAPKPACLRLVEVAHDNRADESAREAAAIDRLARELADAAQRLVRAGLRSVVVFANCVATARKTRTLLLRGSDGPEAEVILLTGRMRTVDRETVAERLARWDLHSSRSIGRTLEGPVIVVATQTLEVGADLDFDGLVTECASLDALRQRFGRLNRMGRRDVESRAEILVRSDQATKRRGGKDDPVYGKALTNTWRWLAQQKRSAEREGKNVAGEVDFGIAAMEDLLKELPRGKDDLAALNAQGRSAPVMLPAHVDGWAQTSPEPVPSPDVALFLRGPETGMPDVHVCWRADLDLSSNDNQEDAIESLTLCPPSSSETLPVPIGVFRRWLAGTGAEEDFSADVPHAENGDEMDAASGTGRATADAGATRRIVRWRGARTSREEVTATPGDLRPGDVIVVPTAHPGPWWQLGDVLLSDESASADALDVGDPSHRLARAKPILRLHPKLVASWPDAVTAKPAALALLEELEQRYEDEPDEIAHVTWALLGALAATDASADALVGWTWLPTVARELRKEFSRPARLRREYRIVGARGLVLAGRRRIAKLAGRVDTFSDEDDTSASGTAQPSGRPVLLRSHLKGVEELARRHAAGCGLPDELTEAIARAGSLHDIGKVDPRFQRLLRAGSPSVGGARLAKSAQMPTTREAWRRACETVGYPKGARHELLTVRLAEESHPSLLPSDPDLRDLILHLLASHHGYCRPFAPVVPGDDAPAVTLELLDNGAQHRMRWSGPTHLERLDSGVADRFWRLTRRYGWWGLAWLESLLRLADWRRSEWEEAHDVEA